MGFKLPDFNDSKRWEVIRKKMGISEISNMTPIDIPKISIEELTKLRDNYISIDNIKDFIVEKDQTFEYKGQKVLLYIKHQTVNLQYYDPGSEYADRKYHLCYCDVLDKMEKKGRFERYVVTQKLDGLFKVDIIDRLSGNYIIKDEYKKMHVCKVCIKNLQEKYTNDETIIFPPNFSLRKFIEKHNTRHTKKPKHTPETLPENVYTDDWEKVSKQKRELANWTCSKCNKSFVNNKSQLHVHHKNGIRNDNNGSNLAVLCKKCHSQEPGHQKLNYLK